MYIGTIKIQFHMRNIKCFHLLQSDSDTSYEFFDLHFSFIYLFMWLILHITLNFTFPVILSCHDCNTSENHLCCQSIKNSHRRHRHTKTHTANSLEVQEIIPSWLESSLFMGKDKGTSNYFYEEENFWSEVTSKVSFHNFSYIQPIEDNNFLPVSSRLWKRLFPKYLHLSPSVTHSQHLGLEALLQGLLSEWLHLRFL